jgi:hypothetical protein
VKARGHAAEPPFKIHLGTSVLYLPSINVFNDIMKQKIIVVVTKIF